jgi:hypothetical protein
MYETFIVIVSIVLRNKQSLDVEDRSLYCGVDVVKIYYSNKILKILYIPLTAYIKRLQYRYINSRNLGLLRTKDLT